jgi:aminoglycoside phosphotransferase family enzyme
MASRPNDQVAVIDFLSRPETYRTGEAVERIETHCSIVFLVGERAYKLKRGIRYSSLDYRALDRRRAACDAELVLNRRTAPELYLGVYAVTRDRKGVLAFDGSGRPIDYVVVMRRFAQAALFDKMADAGTLTPGLMGSLGQTIARLHLAAEVTRAFGGAAAIRRVISHNERELAKVAAELDGAAISSLTDRTRCELDRLAVLLDRRRAEGKVRRCHGDLRLANICLFAGRPTLFDCIEFSDEIGCVDTLYDLAFLLMDLNLRGLGALGKVVLEAYLAPMPESDGLQALPLFLALRAATRAYAVAGAARRHDDPTTSARRMIGARRHVEAGIAFLSDTQQHERDPDSLIPVNAPVAETANERSASADSGYDIRR